MPVQIRVTLANGLRNQKSLIVSMTCLLMTIQSKRKCIIAYQVRFWTKQWNFVEEMFLLKQVLSVFCLCISSLWFEILERYMKRELINFFVHLQVNVPYIVMNFHKMWLLIRTTAPNSHRDVQKRSISQKMHTSVRFTKI